MATLRAVRKRIKSAQNIKQITKAMKMVAAAKLKKAQDKILSARPYSAKIEEVIADLIGRADDKKYMLLKKNSDVKKEAIFLITSDKGLCGSFNINLVKEAVIKLKENQDIDFFIIGKKGLDSVKKFGKKIEIFKFNDNKIQWEDIDEAAELLIKNFTADKYKSAEVIFSEFKTSLQQKVVKKQLLPIVFEPKKSETGIVRDFLYEPGEEIVLSNLLIRYIKTVLYRAVLETQASEHGVRMVAMDMATNNASDMIDSLTLLANKTRQAAITKEILEIVSGAEALK